MVDLSRRAGLALGIAAGATVLAPSAFAQSPWPAGQPIKIMVGFPAGGASDVMARIIATKLSQGLGVPVVVENRPGAAGTLAASLTARAAPDGYTLLLMSAAYPLVPQTYTNLSVDLMKSLAPISLMSKRSALLLIHPSVPAKNMAEFVAYARANPEKLNFATAGPGGLQHLTGLWLASAINAKFTYIHYKGTGSLMPDMLAGRAHVTPTTFSTGLNLVKSGKLRPLGVASLERNAQLPDMPTVAEQGYPGWEYTTWLGVLAPERTSPAIISKLSNELARVAKAPDIQQRLGADTKLIGSTPEEFRKHIGLEYDRWKKLIQENNLKFDLQD
jgi:tripartite-type tricarboxylate transporter receptor subunit TctC